MDRFLSGFKDIVDLYDIFIFDIWGVIHDGHSAYPSVQDTLKFLLEKGKTVCFLSNSPKTGQSLHKTLNKLGIEKDWYSLAYTAGDSFEHSFNTIYNKDKKSNWFVLDENKVSNVKQLLLDSGMTVVNKVEEANKVIVASVDERDFALKKYKHFISACFLHDIDVYSSNADYYVISENEVLLRPAHLMSALESVGVNVIQHGKPNLNIYHEIFNLLPQSDKKRMVMIGDSLTTDIRGANAANMDSILIYKSYHIKKSMFHFSEGVLDSSFSFNSFTEKNLQKLLLKINTQPTYFIPTVSL